MKIRHNRRGKIGLSAALMTRDVACSMYAPGSDGWNRWQCGPVASPPPAPAPPPTQMYTPAPPPVQYAVPPPKIVAPPPANIDYDAEYARRVQAAENDKYASQLIADQQSKLAADQAAKASAAQSELDTIRANAAASMSAFDAGGAGYGFSNAQDESGAAPAESNSNVTLAVLAALAAFAIFARGKSRGRQAK